MTLLEFLSLGLSHGQKVRIKFKNENKTNRADETGFYMGLRLRYGTTVTTCNQDVAPIFYQCSAKGKPLRKRIDSTWFFLLESVERIGETIPDADQNESPTNTQALKTAYLNINSNATHRLALLLDEMRKIFPGKAVAIHPDEGIGVTVHHKYDDECGSVTAIWADEKGVIHIDANTNSEYIEDCQYDFTFDSWPELLWAVTKHIAEPLTRREAQNPEDAFALTGETSYKDIPEPDKFKYPRLTHSGLLRKLKRHLWFYGLDEKEAAEVFPEEKKEYLASKSDATFRVWLESKWLTMSTVMQIDAYNRATAED